MIAKRIFFDLVFLSVVFYAPWWLAFIIATLGAFYFSQYYEVVVIGALFDILYGVREGVFIGHSIQGFLVGIAIFVSMERIKRELR